jgi:hypothetical protein
VENAHKEFLKYALTPFPVKWGRFGTRPKKL